VNEDDSVDFDIISTRLREQATAGAIRITVHAHQEMAEEDISLDEVTEVLLAAKVLEDYPEHKRGPCCLVCQRTSRWRYVHVVCTTSLEVAIIITAYEPRKPKWVTPFERGRLK